MLCERERERVNAHVKYTLVFSRGILSSGSSSVGSGSGSWIISSGMAVYGTFTQSCSTEIHYRDMHDIRTLHGDTWSVGDESQILKQTSPEIEILH